MKVSVYSLSKKTNVNQFRNVCESLNKEKGHHLYCVVPTDAPMEMSSGSGECPGFCAVSL